VSVPRITFFAAAEAVILHGGVPIFGDDLEHVLTWVRYALRLSC